MKKYPKTKYPSFGNWRNIWQLDNGSMNNIIKDRSIFIADTIRFLHAPIRSHTVVPGTTITTRVIGKVKIVPWIPKGIRSSNKNRLTLKNVRQSDEVVRNILSEFLLVEDMKFNVFTNLKYKIIYDIEWKL